MPKYIYEEDTLREWASLVEEGAEEGQAPLFDIEEPIAQLKRESDGQLSSYESAQCPISEDALDEYSRRALTELRVAHVTQLFIDYDGGNDEGFAHFRAATVGDEIKTFEQLAQALEEGPLGDTPEAQPIYLRQPPELSRLEWTISKMEDLLYELTKQLLGRGFGTGEYSLQGTFVADLQANTLTDIAPEEN